MSDCPHGHPPDECARCKHRPKPPSPPDREGRVGLPLGHEHRGKSTACCAYPGCSKPRSAHTGGDADPYSGLAERRVIAPPQPAPQGGGGVQGHSPEPWLAFRMVDEHGTPLRGEAAAKYVAECISANPDGDFYAISCTKADGKDYDVCHTGNGSDSLVNAARIVACVAACRGVADPQPGALASRDSLIAQQAEELDELRAWRAGKRGVEEFFAEREAKGVALFKVAAQAAEIERLRAWPDCENCDLPMIHHATRGYYCPACEYLERAERAEQERDALRASHAELLDRLQHEDDCQFQYGPPRLECDCGLDAVIARAKALRPESESKEA